MSDLQQHKLVAALEQGGMDGPNPGQVRHAGRDDQGAWVLRYEPERAFSDLFFY